MEIRISPRELEEGIEDALELFDMIIEKLGPKWVETLGPELSDDISDFIESWVEEPEEEKGEV